MKIRNVYIIDDQISSKVNGIGSYIRELIHCLKELHINICLISLNSENNDFQIEFENDIKKILFPIKPGTYFSNYKMISYFLKLYIDDASENLFLVNHSPCEKFLKEIKRLFPLSKIAFVIHDMGWTNRLLGDTHKLEEIISSTHLDDIEKEYRGIIDYFYEEQRMYNIVDKVIVLAKETKLLLQNTYSVNDEKIYLAPNGLSYFYKSDMDHLSDTRVKLNISKKEKIILFVGRVNKIKGIYELINAFKNVLKEYGNCRLVIIGTLFDHINTLKYSSNIAPKITFTGQISLKELKDWYRIADIGVLSSYVEQCSYTGIEMMMYGLPVVASDGFCVKDMFNKSRKNSLIAKIGPRNTPKVFETNLSNAILELLNSNKLRKELGLRGRDIYRSCYSIINMQKAYEKLLCSF